MSASPVPSVRRALLRAIQIERRNSELYEALAQIFDGYESSVRDVFLGMAEEERKHGAELRERYRAKFGPVPLLTGEPHEVIEAADLQDAEALIFDSMTPETALQTGLLAEEAAREFYRAEVSRTSDPELLKTYRELGEFEDSHVRLLRQKLLQQRLSPRLSPR